MYDGLIAVLVLLTAYSIAVTSTLVWAWRQWGRASTDATEYRLLLNDYLRSDAMRRHPAGRARLPYQVEAHALDAARLAAENPGTVIHGVWPAQSGD